MTAPQNQTAPASEMCAFPDCTNKAQRGHGMKRKLCSGHQYQKLAGNGMFPIGSRFGLRVPIAGSFTILTSAADTLDKSRGDQTRGKLIRRWVEDRARIQPLIESYAEAEGLTEAEVLDEAMAALTGSERG